MIRAPLARIAAGAITGVLISVGTTGVAQAAVDRVATRAAADGTTVDSSEIVTATPSPSSSASVSASAGASSSTTDGASSSTSSGASGSAAKWANPLPGAEITSCYGSRWGTVHEGIDFAAAENTPEHAVAAGTIVAAGWNYSGYGISVLIDHGNGLYTHYAHMNKAAVTVGQKVAAGDIIGYEGSTGDSTGPHLHFEVWQGMWNQIDPADWLAARGIETGC